MQTNAKMEELGASITRVASLQTYTTVRFLVDRKRVSDAYRAYAYFRWVDDWLDEPARQKSERLSFVRRQGALVDACYRGAAIPATAPEENMLAALVDKDREPNSGLQAYIRNMMSVMAFDAERRGRLISAAELDRYARALATAVTEALHYFIGHGSASPNGPERYLAAEGAHITHMLRDTLEDNELGYFNIPREYIRAHGISPFDIASEPYRSWVRGRVELARSCFLAGRRYLSGVQSLRCRLACYAYVARFETVLDSIERDAYMLRRQYREVKGPKAGTQMGWSVIRSVLGERRPVTEPGGLVFR
jgi:phytoene/squalene synthetase